ncbi:MAG: ATP-dependent zinc metalloprotease FtsH [Patescibacteria group bacterium]|nr:ATP-dependent zinc metalloprotease FtsH [Patescibacteria group bacterium]
MPTNNNFGKNFTIIIIVILLGLLAYSFWAPKTAKPQESNITDIAQKVNKGEIDSITVEGNQITAKVKNDGELKAYKESGIGLNEYGITPDKVQVNIQNPDKGAFWSSLLSLILPIILIAIFFFWIVRSAQGANVKAMSFGKTSARVFGKGETKITFANVAGAREAKEELQEVVEFLKHPAKFKQLGAEIPKGTILFGPPGCGKTLLAKAVAGEAGVPFFSLSASEFVEMFVGVGAARVRDLFQKAKRNAPCVIFIDELDAVGRQRGAGLGGSHDEREQTLNQILVEMDGFETDARVIVIAATNRPDILDPALLRPGRFDRRVVLDLPDRKDREEILKIHAKNKPLVNNLDFTKIAAGTPGLSGADLKNIVNEAAILAARNNKKEIIQHDFDEAIEKVMIGPEKKSRLLSDKEKKISAYHESGHAIIGNLLPNCDPIHKVSIVSRGMALGYTWSLPEEDKHLYSQSKFNDEISQLLGGWAAEKIIFGETTTGAQNDLKRATRIARDMVTIYGMSNLGPIALGEREELVFLGKELGEHKTYSEKVAAQIDEEISRLIETNKLRALDILKKNKRILDNLANKLLKEETIETKEFKKLFNEK